jgi:SAM-dependent methyltransferase
MTEARGDQVRAQYERWVYPQPLEHLDGGTAWDSGDPHFLGRAYWPHRPPREALRILVAGCGPNAAARYAYHHPRATVVGIDISEASLGHARRLKEKHALDNLTLRRLRIEDVRELGGRFDFVDASGVLHHLPEPREGLAAIAGTLEDDGVVYLMLYARYGRAGIYLAQELFRRLGLGQTPEDVAAVKSALGAFGPGHPVRRCFTGPNDLNFDAGIVDTFLHPVDRAYTVTDCYELLESAGLVLQGWLNRYAYDPASRVAHPALRERFARLPEREAVAALELLDGAIATHSFYACRRERDPAHYRIDFEGGAFLERVPVPRPGAKCAPGFDSVVLQEPSGSKLTLRGRQAAAALRIDGRRTVRACYVESGGGGLESPAFVASLCREVFRPLWLIGYCDLVPESAI